MRSRASRSRASRSQSRTAATTVSRHARADGLATLEGPLADAALLRWGCSGWWEQQLGRCGVCSRASRSRASRSQSRTAATTVSRCARADGLATLGGPPADAALLSGAWSACSGGAMGRGRRRGARRPAHASRAVPSLSCACVSCGVAGWAERSYDLCPIMSAKEPQHTNRREPRRPRGSSEAVSVNAPNPFEQPPTGGRTVESIDWLLLQLCCNRRASLHFGMARNAATTKLGKLRQRCVEWEHASDAMAVKSCILQCCDNGGLQRQLKNIISDEEETTLLWCALVARLPDRAMRSFRTIVHCHRSFLPPPQEGSLVAAALESERVRMVATRAMLLWRSFKRAKLRLREPEPPPQPPEAAGKRRRASCSASTPLPRPPAIGRLPNLFPNVRVDPAIRRPLPPHIPAWSPPASATRQAAVSSLPGRTRPYQPSCSAQSRQLENVRSWKLSRLIKRDGRDVLFTIGQMQKAVRTWQQQGGAGTPPVRILEKAAWRVRAPTGLASETGHIWSARLSAPLDAGQMAALWHSAWVAGGAQRLVTARVASESQLRSLFGQATDGHSMEAALARLDTLSSGRLGRTASATIGAVGAGFGLSALQAARWLGAGAQLAWMAEACPIAQPAGRAMVEYYGHRPQYFARAEEAAMANPALRTTLEIITLRCSPFSRADPHYPQGVDAAIGELLVVMERCAARLPSFIVYENTAGVAEDPSILRRLENALRVHLPNYVWGAIVTSPAQHADSGQGRWRVFFLAYHSA